MLLPALDLILWAILALVPATLYYLGFEADARDPHPLSLVAPQPDAADARTVHASPEQIASAQLAIAMEGRGYLLTALNLPAMVPEVLTSLPTTWPESWHPQGIDLFTWRALVFPLYALPAWWFAGVCLDAMLGRRRLHWASAFTALLLFVFCAAMTVAMSLRSQLRDAADLWLVLGSVLWASLFSLAPLAWWLQRRRQRAVPAATASSQV